MHHMQEEFEDTKQVIRCRKYNDQTKESKKRNRDQHTSEKTKK